GKKPSALLYLLLRHALQLGFHSTAMQLLALGQTVPAARWREPEFVHVKPDAPGSESRYAPLFAPATKVTGSTTMLLGDHIARFVTSTDPELREQIEAIERLAAVPTARLERAFAEHIDCCTYRLDAWKTGVMALWLERLRSSKPVRSRGI